MNAEITRQALRATRRTLAIWAACFAGLIALYAVIWPSVRGNTSWRNLFDTLPETYRALFTASAEVQHPITPRLPALWGAAFVDAGNAAQRFSDLKPKVGVGVGVRYRSPVGPLRFDVAYGVDDRRVRLHLSAGVSF